MPPRRPNLSNIFTPTDDNDWERENLRSERRAAFDKMVKETADNPPKWVKTGFDIVAFALVIALCSGIAAVVIALLIRFAMWIL